MTMTNNFGFKRDKKLSKMFKEKLREEYKGSIIQIKHKIIFNQ